MRSVGSPLGVRYDIISPKEVNGKGTRLYSEIEGTCLLTPEGFGFSSTTERILAKSNRGTGFYTASKDARVIDVMGGITEGKLDAALVYDQNELIGIFTESDYIKVSS